MERNQFVQTSDTAPILLRRVKPRPVFQSAFGNMTVVTTQGNEPEMHDQRDDPTAPRND